MKIKKYAQEVWEEHSYVSKPQAVLLSTVPCGSHSGYNF